MVSYDNLPNAVLYRRDRTYYLGLENHKQLVKFTVPTIKEVLKSCKLFSRKPPTIYIIFRNPVQNCLRDLNRKFDRKDVSRISSKLWKYVKQHEPQLNQEFENLYRDTREQWRKQNIIFQFFTPL